MDNISNVDNVDNVDNMDNFPKEFVSPAFLRERDFSDGFMEGVIQECTRIILIMYKREHLSIEDIARYTNTSVDMVEMIVDGCE